MSVPLKYTEFVPYTVDFADGINRKVLSLDFMISFYN